jgi:hypothetical protein
MDIGTALVVVAGIGAWYSLRAKGVHPLRHLRGRDRHAEAADSPAVAAGTPREAELQREVEQLRDRVHVLERIATDANNSNGRQTRELAAEIESLRER